MRRKLRLLSLMIALCALFQVQTVIAQNQNVLFLPGTNATSSLTVPVLNSKITTFPFTIEMWVKPNTITPYGGFFFDKSGGSVKTCFQFANSSTGEMRFDLLGGASIVPLTAAKKLVVNKWQHLAVTVYRDSAVVEIDGSFYSAAHTKLIGAFGSAISTIGLDVDVANRTFNGYMDEVRIWKSARSRSEITLYKDSILNPAAQADLVAYYNFNDLTANDATANALNATKNLTAAIGNLASDGRLGNLNATGGLLTPTFNPDTLNYAFYAPHGVTVTGVPIGEGAVVTNGLAAPTIASPNFTMVSTSKDGATTKTYNVNTTFMPFSSWDSDGKTGIGSEANLWGWGINDVPLAWGQTNGSLNRYQDITTGWTFNNGTTTVPWTGRLLYIRWDGTGGTTINSLYSYAMYLEGCKTYELNTKYAWVNNSTVPTATFTISKDRLATNSIITETALCSSTKQVFQNKKMVFTPTTSGVYYFTCKANTTSLMALGDMTLAESTVAAINTNLTSAAFSDATKTYKFFVTGNLLTDTIKLTAPAGILLNKSFILASEAPCGVEVTATYDYTQPLTTGNITLTSGATVKNVALTYAKPSINVYEQDVEVENNGKVYPLNVTSVNNTVDSLYVTASTGLTLVKSAFSNADFVAGAGKIKVNVSSSVSGTTGTLVFSTKKNVPASNLDTVNVAAVAPYVRYYIKHKASSFVIGSHTTGLYPALTTAKELVTQKFILRRTNPLSLTDTTFYILQDTAYRAVKKVATSNWDTEFGVPSNDSKWTIQQKGNGVVTLTNVVTAKAVGTDAPALNGRMYDDKVWAANGNMEWVIQTIPVLTVSSNVLPAFKATPEVPATKTIKIGGSGLMGNIKAVLSGTHASLYKVSYDTLAPVAGTASDSTLTITYTPLAIGVHLAKLTISTPFMADVVINLNGSYSLDYTSSIVNPGIDATSNTAQPNGWVVTKGTGNNISGVGQHYSLVATNRYLDSYNGTAGSMIYTATNVVKNIPNGIYDVIAAARTSGTKSYIFGNYKQTEIINNGGAGGTLGNGFNTITVEKVVVLDSMISIGAKTVTGWTGQWFSADDFKLQYYGAGDYVTYKPVLDSLVAKAKRFNLATSPDGDDAVLAAAITTAEAANDLNSVLSSYTVLNKAYNTNAASVAPYAKLLALVTSSTTLSNTTAYNATTLTTFKAAIVVADGIAKAATTLSADVNAAIIALNKAIYDYKASQPAPADFTFVLANPGFEEGTTSGIDPTSIKKNGGFNTPIGWNVWAKIDTLAPGANFVGISSSTTMAEGTRGYETWVQGGFSKSINLSQKVVAPATGYYTLTGKLRCDGSSPSLSDPLKFDAQVYAIVGSAAEVKSIKLAEAPGLITASGWNTKAAWRTLTVFFKANAGDTVKLGAASTSFMQLDNFTLDFKGNNNPATLDVAYITKVKVMDAAADSIKNDPIYRMLSRDPKLNVVLVPLTNVAVTATFDQSPYDALVIQETIGGGDGIFFPAGALGLSKLSVPTLYNKAYAFKAGRALVAPAAGTATGLEGLFGSYSMKIDSVNRLNPLFKGITFTADTVQLFTKGAQDAGSAPTAVLSTNKALNLANNVTGTEGTRLAYPNGLPTTQIFLNNVVAPDTLGGQPIKTRMILFGLNSGAILRDHGKNVTNAQYTLWRNAVYSLVGLTIPETGVSLPAVVNVKSMNDNAFGLTNVDSTSVGDSVKIGGYNLSGAIKLTLSGVGASMFKLSYDTLAAVAGAVKDSILIINYKPTAAGVHNAKLTIGTLNCPDYVINLSGSAKKDVTSWIVNPGIDAASGSVQPNGWFVTKGTGNSFTNTGQHYSGVAANRYLDSWNGTAGSMIYTATQVVKSIPNGIYDMSAAARTSGLKSYIFANDKQTEIINNGNAGGTLSNGWNTIPVTRVVVLDSTISIGAKTVTGWTGFWFGADDFKMTYYGPGEYADYKTTLDSLIAKASRFDLNTSPNGLDGALTASINTAVAANNEATVMSSYKGLKSAFENNMASVPTYTKLKDLIASSTVISNTTNFNGLAALKTAITVAETVANGPTTMPLHVDTAIVNLNKALYAYRITQPAPADFTFIMANPSFEEGTVTGIDPASIKKNGGFNTPRGWNVYAVIDTLAPGANFVNISGASMADGNNGYETWVQGGFNKSINVSQKIVAPGAGYYLLTAKARCDGSSGSMTDPLKWDAQLYAEVPNKPQFKSKKLAEMPGLITGSGWNTKAAWRTLTLAFTANAGDTIKLGLASTSFMQMDNFTLAYRGNNNPSTIDVAYITKVKVMDALSDSVQNDPVYRMLKQDTLLTVTLKAITDVSAAATFDQSSYDALIIQESVGGGDAILFPANALGLPKLSVPTLFNKTYAFKAGRALVAPAAGTATGAEATAGIFALKVDSINKTNPLFRGITFVADTVQMFTKAAQDNGAAPTTVANSKALNVANNVLGIEGTLLAYPTGMTTTLCMNDIPAGDTIGGQITKARIITFGLNFGAMSRDHGQNMTNANYTLWRNAVYSLVGLTIPNTPMNVVTALAKPAEANGLSVVVYPNPTTSNINIANLNLNSTVKIFNMTGQQVFNGKANTDVMTVDMSRYSNGIYMLQVVSNGKTMKSKIIKK